MKQPRSSRLTAKILLLILGAGLLQVLLSGIVTQQGLRSDMQSLLIEQQKRLNGNAVRLIERELDIRKHFLATLAAQQALDGQVSYTSSAKLIASQQQSIDLYFPGGVAILNASGIAVGESTRVEGRLGTSYADRPHIRQALDSGQPGISKPIMGRTTRTPILSISAPVKNAQGRVIGLIAGGIQLEQENLFDVAVNTTLGSPSRLFVMDMTHQMYVTASDPELAMQPHLLRGRRPSGKRLRLLRAGQAGGDQWIPRPRRCRTRSPRRRCWRRR